MCYKCSNKWCYTKELCFKEGETEAKHCSGCTPSKPVTASEKASTNQAKMLKTIIKDINATSLLAINEEDIPVSSLQKKRKGNEESEEPGESSPTPTLRFDLQALSEQSQIEKAIHYLQKSSILPLKFKILQSKTQ